MGSLETKSLMLVYFSLFIISELVIVIFNQLIFIIAAPITYYLS